VYDGAPNQAIPFTYIHTILDEHGHDVTARVLSGEAPTSDTVSDAAASGARRQRSPAGSGENTPGRRWTDWRVAWVLDVGGDLPLGEYYGGTRGGAGFGSLVHVAVSDKLALRAGSSLLGMDFESRFGAVSFGPGTTIVSQDYDIDAWRYEFGVEYWSPLRRWDGRRGFWYVHTSVGVIQHRLDGHAVVRAAGRTETVTASDRRKRFATSSGIGMVYVLRPRLGVTLSGDVNCVWSEVRSEDGSTSHEPNGFIYGARMGLALVP
jgi:hypothetical protein